MSLTLLISHKMAEKLMMHSVINTSVYINIVDFSILTISSFLLLHAVHVYESYNYYAPYNIKKTKN